MARILTQRDLPAMVVSYPMGKILADTYTTVHLRAPVHVLRVIAVEHRGPARYLLDSAVQASAKAIARGMCSGCLGRRTADAAGRVRRYTSCR